MSIKERHNTETRFLIHILARKTVGEMPASMDTDRLIRLAINHRVTYQLLHFARQHEGLFSERQKQRLEVHARENAIRSLMQLHELVRIAGMLGQKAISWACIKGPQLSRMLYGREALKESVDLDLMLLDKSQLDIVHRGLKDLGYGHSNLDDYRSGLAKRFFLMAKREVHYFNGEKGVHLDLHVRAAANAYLTISRHRQLFRYLTPYELEGTSVPILPHGEYLNFLCHHGAMHQFSSLGWLIDVRHFIKHMNEGWGTAGGRQNYEEPDQNKTWQKKGEMDGESIRQLEKEPEVEETRQKNGEMEVDRIRKPKREQDFEQILKVARGTRTERSLLLSFVLLNELFGDEMPELVQQQGGQERKDRKEGLDNHDRRLKYLVRACRRRWSMDAAASLSLRGRLDRFLYLMVLSEGLAAKADIVIGMLIRSFLPLLRWLHL